MTRDSRKRSYAAKLGYCTKRVYDSFFSSRTTVEAGRNWYPKAFEIAGNIHQSPIAGAGVIAALSPQCAWKTNLSWAEKVCRGTGFSVSTFRNRDKAMAIASMENPSIEEVLDVLGGDKVRRFFLNIVGNENVVTIDGWAAFIAEGRVYKPSQIKGLRYCMLERSYQNVAKLVGESPRTVQAATWIHTRGKED